MLLRPYGALLVLAVGGMRQLARLAELADVTLSGLLVDAERSGDLEVGRAIESFWQGCQELLPDGIGELVAASWCRCRTRENLKDCCRVLQQDFDHRESGGKVGIGTDQVQLLLPLLVGLRLIVDEAKDGQGHREAKEDEAEAADRGNDVVAKQLSVAKLGGLKELVELLLLGTAEGELDALLREGLVEIVEVAANLLKLLIGDAAGAGKHIVPYQLRRHGIEDETAEQTVFGIGYQIEDLLRRS